MGTKTHVSTICQNLFDADDWQNIAQMHVPRSVLELRDISRNLLNAYSTSNVVRARAAYTYAKNHYTYGLPNGYRSEIDHRDTAVLQVIRATEPTASLVTNQLDTCDVEFFAYTHLQQLRGWVRETNAVMHPPFTPDPVGAPVYFAGARISELVNANNKTELELFYTLTQGELNNQALTNNPYKERIEVERLYPDTHYYHTVYAVSGVEYFWTYRAELNTHPTLPPLTIADIDSPFMPVIPLRQHKQNMVAESRKDTELYRTSLALGDKLGIDVLSLGESINSNPNVIEYEDDDDNVFGVNQVNIMMGVDILSDRPATQRYLMDVFTEFATTDAYTESSFDITNLRPNRNIIEISDGGFRSKLSYSYIRTRTHTGSIGTIGDITRHVHRETIGPKWAGDNSWDNSYIRFYEQVTANSYREVTVHGLMNTSYCMGNRPFETSLSDISEAGNHNLIIPIHFRVAENRSFDDQSKLYHDSMKLVMNSYVEEDIAWYETDLFKFVVLVIAVIGAVYSAGQSLALISAAYTFGASFAVGAAAIALGVMAVTLTIALMYGAGQLINIAFTKLAEELGPEWAIVVSAVLVVAAIAAGPVGAGALESTTANSLIFVGNNLAAGTQQHTANEMAELQDDVADAMAEREEQQAELDELTGKLDDIDKSPLDYVTFIDRVPMFVAGESPSSFYARTIHSGNIGTTSYEMIHSFVDQQLTLPKTNYTLDA